VTARLNVRGGAGTVVVVLLVVVLVAMVLVAMVLVLVVGDVVIVVLAVRGLVVPGFADAAMAELALVVVGVRSRTTARGAAATDVQATHSSAATTAPSPFVTVVCRLRSTVLYRPRSTREGSHPSTTGRGMPAVKRPSDRVRHRSRLGYGPRYIPAGRIRRPARP